MQKLNLSNKIMEFKDDDENKDDDEKFRFSKTLTLVDVPEYLRTSSELFKLLTGNDEDTEYTVFSEETKYDNYFKLDPTTDFFVMACKLDLVINNTEDLIELLITLSYWQVSDTKWPIRIYRYIYEHRGELMSNEEFIRYMQRTPLDLQFLIHLDQYVGLKTTAAARYGYIKSLQVLHENDFPWDANTCKAAAENGHLDCLQYAHCPRNEYGFYYGPSCDWSMYACDAAAENGHLECLKYLYNPIDVWGNFVEPRCDWSWLTCRAAARGGHLDCLKYLRYPTDARGVLVGPRCPWNEYTSLAAAENGHLDCLKYAHENGCMCDWRICAVAESNDHLDCLQYAIDNKFCPSFNKKK